MEIKAELESAELELSKLDRLGQAEHFCAEPINFSIKIFSTY